MISRRAFGTGIAAVVALFSGVRPSMGKALPEEGVISPRLSKLADVWSETAQSRRRIWQEIFEPDPQRSSRLLYPDPNCPQMVRWRAERRVLAEASAAVLREPSRNASDVILKYHVIDMNYGRCGIEDSDWISLDGGPLYAGVWREARAYGIDINPIWTPERSSRYAEIDGDRYSPKWRAVARWSDPYGFPNTLPDDEVLFQEILHRKRS